MLDLHSDLHLISMLSEWLEHISADSIWAHRASGLRGGLLSIAEKIENGIIIPQSDMKQLLDDGFQILEKAAQGMGSVRFGPSRRGF